MKYIMQTEEFISSYDTTLKELQKKGAYIDTIPTYTFRDYGTDLTYLLVLAFDYGTYDFSYRDPLLFLDIEDIEMRNSRLGFEKAVDDYVKSKYGNDYLENARGKADSLIIEYNIAYLDSIIKKVIAKGYVRKMKNDTLEIGFFDKKVLDSLPFRVEIDTTGSFCNIEFFDFKESKENIWFYPTKRSTIDTTKYLMPAAYLKVFWDSTKTNYPYHKSIFKKVLLQDKYEWRGASKGGLVNVDEEKNNATQQ